MRFGILGQAAAWRADGSSVPLPRPKTRALLSMLALDAGTVVSTDRLIDAVYADDPPQHSTNALQAQVSRLRRQLGAGPDLVEFHGHGYRLVIEPASVDVYEFEDATERGRNALESGDHERASEVLGDALSLWRGPALTDLPDSPTARERIARLEELRLAAIHTLAEADLARGDVTSTLPRLRELVAGHPLREDLWQLLIRALADAGRRAEALSTYEEARTMLSEELGTDPSPALIELHLAVLREEPAPPTTSRTSGPPAQLTRLFGRDEELDRIADLLGGERLVTLTGPGGAGKTRLAVEAAGREAQEVCFVELAPVADIAQVPAAVSNALGLRTHGTSEETLQRLTNVLAQRPILLVLDNCEHLAGAVATLAARLLAGCPDLRVLTTSREPLEITGEVLQPVSALDVPSANAGPDTALDYSAVRLFADRATAVVPGFTVGPTNGTDVVTICRALDGIPLAIELAAARARTLPLPEIAARLNDPFTLLSRGDRTKDARHQTLRAVVEWSWELLSDPERALASRLSVFAGGASRDAADRVCDLPETEDLLTGLVDKSLLDLRDGRYRMLETIRAYAAERLTDADESDRWHRRHAAYFLDVAQDADPGLRGAGQLEWLALLDADYDNLRAALRWGVANDVAMALRLTSALAMYWWLRGRRHEGARFGAAVADAVGTQPPAQLEEEYLLAVFLAADSTDPEPLRRHLATVNRIAATRTGTPRQPMLTVLWARLSGPAPESGTALTAPSANLLDSDPWGHALHPMSDGLQQLHTGRAEAAEHSFRTALTRFREIGERWGTMKCLMELARFASWRDEQDVALDLLDEAIELSGRLTATEDMSQLLCRRARCAARTGDLDRARTDAANAFELANETGEVAHVARARATVAHVERLSGYPEAAAATAHRALAECGSGWVRPSEVRTEVLLVLAGIATHQGRTDDARDCCLEVVADGDVLAAASASESLAAVAVAQEDGAWAARLLAAATALRGATRADHDVRQTTDAARGLAGTEEFDDAYAAVPAAVSRTELLTCVVGNRSAPDQ